MINIEHSTVTIVPVNNFNRSFLPAIFDTVLRNFAFKVHVKIFDGGQQDDISSSLIAGTYGAIVGCHSTASFLAQRHHHGGQLSAKMRSNERGVSSREVDGSVN